MNFIDGLPESLPAGRRRSMIDRRYAQLLRSREAAIAETETLTVGNHGQLLTWQKAAREKQLDSTEYFLEWLTRAVKVCPRCRAMDGATREIERGEFVSDGSGPLGVETAPVPDLHPRGFCIMRAIRRRDALRPPAQLAA